MCIFSRKITTTEFRINLNFCPKFVNFKGIEDAMENIGVFHSFSYDVVLNQPPSYVLKKYKEMNASVVFSAEDLTWPDQSLAVSFVQS